MRKTATTIFFTVFFLFLIMLCPLENNALPRGSAVAAYEEGRVALEDGNYYLAIEKFKSALAINPDYLDPMKGLAESFFNLDEYAESLRFIQQGKKYGKNDLFLLNLEGKIDIVMGNLDNARGLFSEVLRREPNNIDAMTGIALLDIAGGRTRFAAKQFEDALVVNPRHRTTLLALALIYENLGEISKAGRYIELALSYHSNHFLVHYIAGRMYYLTGDYAESESHLKTALALQGDYEPARMLLGNLYVVTGKNDRAVEILRPLLAERPDNVRARYVLGMAYRRNGDLENAVRSYEGAIGLAKDDEWSRLALEQLAVTELGQGNAKRQALSRERYEQGKLFENRNMLTPALLEYRRSIKLDPVSRDARVAFAGIYKKRGYPMKYLNELEVLKELGIADRKIQDDIEYYRTRRYGRVSEKWGLDQHDIDIPSLTLRLFSLDAGDSLLHPVSSTIITGYFKDVLDGYEKIRLPEGETAVGSFEEAFRTARTGKADFFILLNFSESERTFRARSRLYLGKTGTLLADFSVERTGNDRIRDTLLRLGSNINELLPVRGVLLKKQFDRGVIDLGRIHGLKEKDKLLIVKAGKVTLRSDKIGFTFLDSDVVGMITLDAVDEAVAEGTLEKKSFYDYISAGDEVLVLPDEEAQKKFQESQPSTTSRLLEELVDLK